MHFKAVQCAFLTLLVINLEQRKYTTELSKGQGMVSETLALLRIWEPGMNVADLKALAVEEGVIGRATALRVKDIVGRVFAPRYLTDSGKPAIYIKKLLDLGVSPERLNQVFLVYTCRAHDVLHDFITEVYWTKFAAGATQITRKDALDFLEGAVNIGLISTRWSESMMLRVARYLTGCLSDFKLAGPDVNGSRDILPFRVESITAVFLAHEIHFSGYTDASILENPDWRLFGLDPIEVKYELERISNGHFILQFSGGLLRISWNYGTMEEALNAIATAEF